MFVMICIIENIIYHILYAMYCIVFVLYILDHVTYTSYYKSCVLEIMY